MKIIKATTDSKSYPKPFAVIQSLLLDWNVIQLELV